MSNPTQDVLSLASLPMPVTQDVAGSSPVHPATFHQVAPQAPEGFPSFEPEGFFVGSEKQTEPQVRQTSSKVRHSNSGFLSVAEAAKKLGKSVSTITRWCESGKLPAIPHQYGTRLTYEISPAAIDMLLLIQVKEVQAEKVSKSSLKEHIDLVPVWKTAMAKGFINGRAFSKATITDYSFYVDEFFKRHKKVSIESLKSELARIPTHQIAKRQHCFKAIVCLGKVLVREDALSNSFLEEVKPLYPKRHLPPKRTTVQEEDIPKLLGACEDLQERLLILLLALTGLRATEACNLEWGDVDLVHGVLKVRLGKGGKERKVGLPKPLIDLLASYQQIVNKKTSSGRLFLNRLGKPMSRNGLYQRLERIGLKAKVKVNPHALRRAFVTINANKGRPLQMLQMACGHSDIKTTMSYCRTQEQEVIEAMKDWD